MSIRAKKVLAVLAFLWIVGVVATPTLFADSFKNDSNLQINQPLNDSLFWGGQTATINAPIDGDVFLGAADRVDINSVITGTVFVGATNAVNLGSNARIQGGLFVGTQNFSMASGAEARDVRVGATNINVDGKISRNLSGGGTTVNLNQGAEVGRDVQVAGTSVALNGKVGGNALVAATNLSFGGSVEGALKYYSEKDANITGHSGSVEKVAREQANRPFGSDFFTSQGFQVGALVFGIISALVTGLILLLLAPNTMRETSAKLGRHWLPALLWGLLFVSITPVLAVLVLVITVATAWPISLVLMAMWTVLLVLSGAVVGIALGNLLLGGRANLWLAAIVGILLLQLLLWAIGLIPSVGGWIQLVLNLLVAVFGFGSLLLVIWDGLRGQRVIAQAPPPMMPPPGYVQTGA